MKKRKKDTEVRSKNDTFLTGHNENYALLYKNMVCLIKELQDNGFKVWRYKIEDIVLDSKYQGDVEKLLKVV